MPFAKPPNRRLEVVLFRLGEGSAVLEQFFLQGPVTDGAEHPLAGTWIGPTGEKRLAWGRVGGLRFAPVAEPKRGRPAKTPRNVAACLAARWFIYGPSTPGATGRKSPVGAVVDLWAAMGFRGLGDEKEARVAIKRGGEELLRFDATLYVEDPNLGAVVMAVPNSKIKFDGGRPVYVHARGWAWKYGAETAQYCDVIFEHE